MWFWINYNNGYEVGVTMLNERGYYRQYPLRNFGEHQGDAKMFQYIDCHKLTDTQLRMLIKSYEPKVKYRRVNGNRFVREK